MLFNNILLKYGNQIDEERNKLECPNFCAKTIFTLRKNPWTHAQLCIHACKPLHVQMQAYKCTHTKILLCI